jgi:hypothetical protein
VKPIKAKKTGGKCLFAHDAQEDEDAKVLPKLALKFHHRQGALQVHRFTLESGLAFSFPQLRSP